MATQSFKEISIFLTLKYIFVGVSEWKGLSQPACQGGLKKCKEEEE
jgi:hypothetical protein